MSDAFDIIFHREFVKAVDEALAPLCNDVLQGKPATFEDYKHASGRIAGLTEGKRIAEAVRDRLLKQDRVRDS